MKFEDAEKELRRFQRHTVLRQYDEDGRVLPDCLQLSEAIDTVFSALAEARNKALDKAAARAETYLGGIPEGFAIRDEILALKKETPDAVA